MMEEEISYFHNLGFVVTKLRQTLRLQTLRLQTLRLQTLPLRLQFLDKYSLSCFRIFYDKLCDAS